MRVLGVDPGTRIAGFGCVEQVGRDLHHVGHLSLQLAQDALSLEHRLLKLYQSLKAQILIWKPQVIAVEKVFFAKDATAALKLGHARGVILLCAAEANVPLVEYATREAKKAITGSGAADKDQVAQMIRVLLKSTLPKEKFKFEDESDALALAITHIYMGRSTLTKRSTSRSLAESVRHKII